MRGIAGALLIFSIVLAGRAMAQLPPVPVPPQNPITEEKRVLGKVLFWDEQLSSDDTVACGTCHRPASAGADPRLALHPGRDLIFGTPDDVLGSPGVRRADEAGHYYPDPVFGMEPQVTRRSAQALIGTQWAPEQFWDGRARTTFAAPLYRAMVIIGISVLIATKLQFLGLAIAIVLLGGIVLRLGRQLLGYLWFSTETAPLRGRAVLVSLLILVGMPAGLGFMPLGSSVHVPAVLGRARESVVRLREAGFAQPPCVQAGEMVSMGVPLLDLTNTNLQEQALEVEAEYAAGLLRCQAYEARDRALAEREAKALPGLQARRDRHRARLESLHVVAPVAGEVVDTLPPRQYGEFLERGAAVATIVSGAWEARALLSEQQVTAVAPRIGDPVVFRPRGFPGRDTPGVITRITPQGSRVVPHVAVTHLGGGDIAVLPATKEAEQPFFEVVITLDGPPPSPLHGMSGRVLMSAAREPLGRLVLRRIIHLVDAIFEA